MKHTKGPWQLLLNENGKAKVMAETRGWGRDEVCNMDTGNAEECIANSKLIAAAPDLLNALENIVEQYRATLQQVTGSKNDPAVESMRDTGIFKEALDAIKKAKGE